MKQTVVYVNGLGGNASESEHYVPLFPDHAVCGFDYNAQTPWEAKAEFPPYFEKLRQESDSVILIANSIGAYYALHSLTAAQIGRAFLISPVTEMDAMIQQAGVTEERLRTEQEIQTESGIMLSWEYLCYARQHPSAWDVPTAILYGEHDALIPQECISAFAARIHAPLTVMPAGEHWFHTPEQLAFLDDWLRNSY